MTAPQIRPQTPYLTFAAVSSFIDKTSCTGIPDITSDATRVDRCTRGSSQTGAASSGSHALDSSRTTVHYLDRLPREPATGPAVSRLDPAAAPPGLCADTSPVAAPGQRVLDHALRAGRAVRAVRRAQHQRARRLDGGQQPPARLVRLCAGADTAQRPARGDEKTVDAGPRGIGRRALMREPRGGQRARQLDARPGRPKLAQGPHARGPGLQPAAGS